VKNIFKQTKSVPIIMMIMIGLTCLSCMGLPVRAEEFRSTPSVDSSERNTNAIIDGSFTSGIREATQAEMDYWANVPKKAPIGAASNSRGLINGWYELDRMYDFYYCSQELSYSCGAASVRMALKYLTGIFYSEATVRTGCGTTSGGTSIANMVTYINSQQNINGYVAVYGASSGTMMSNLYSGVSTHQSPPIIAVRESTGGGFPYNLPGHALTIYSVRQDLTQVALCDPWAGYVNDSANRWYDVTSGNLYAGYNALPAGGYMY
jgi:hypothetical protein